jgi:hypothetical protein
MSKYASMANITSISYVERRRMLLFGNILIDTGPIAGGVLIIPVFLQFLANANGFSPQFIIHHSRLPSPFRLPPSPFKIPS